MNEYIFWSLSVLVLLKCSTVVFNSVPTFCLYIVFIQAFILDPLELRDTHHLQSDIPDLPLVRGYWDGTDTTNREYVIPGGSMISTPADTARFIEALARGELFDEEAQALYQQVYSLDHSGWVPGYQTIAGWISNPGVTVVLHVNNTGGASEDTIRDSYQQVLSILRR